MFKHFLLHQTVNWFLECSARYTEINHLPLHSHSLLLFGLSRISFFFHRRENDRRCHAIMLQNISFHFCSPAMTARGVSWYGLRGTVRETLLLRFRTCCGRSPKVNPVIPFPLLRRCFLTVWWFKFWASKLAVLDHRRVGKHTFTF